jgi:lipopolysaccharide export system permease protein
VWLTPWAKAELDAAKDRFAKRSDVSKVSAGQFRESGEGNRVFFVERQSEVTKQVENVFVVDSKGDTRTVVSARARQCGSGRQRPALFGVEWRATRHAGWHWRAFHDH